MYCVAFRHAANVVIQILFRTRKNKQGYNILIALTQWVDNCVQILYVYFGNPYSAGTDFSRRNLTSTDVRF